MSDTAIMARMGRRTVADGAYEALRMDAQAGLAVVQAKSAFHDAVMAGRVFGVCNQAGVTSQAGLSATTPVLTLYNPLGSGVNCVLWYAGATFSVAFATAGAVWVAAGTNVAAAAVTGTATTAHRNLKLGTASNPAASPLLAATLPAAPVAIALLGMGLTGAITVAPQIQTLERWFNGSVILTPGTNISVQTGVASGASGTFIEFIWEEVAE